MWVAWEDTDRKSGRGNGTRRRRGRKGERLQNHRICLGGRLWLKLFKLLFIVVVAVLILGADSGGGRAPGFVEGGGALRLGA